MNLYKILGTSLAMLLVLTQTSCLKDKLNNSDPAAGSNNVVEFQNTSVPVSYTSIYPQYDNGITLTGDTGSFPINLNYTGAIAVAPQEITITLTLDTAALSAFNANQGTSYTLAPSDDIAYATSVTIPKGVNTTQIHAVVTTNSDWDYSKTYALPLTISASSYGIVSSNFGTAIYTFVANNPFAGTYTTTGYFFHPSSPRAISADYTVATTGQYENKFPFADLGSSNYYFAVTTPASGGGALTGYRPIGSTPALPASGFMTADNPGHFVYSPLAPGTAPWVSSTYNNSYDATNKIYYFHIGYAGGGNGQNTFTRQVYMKMVKD
jgi:hypothetical protein